MQICFEAMELVDQINIFCIKTPNPREVTKPQVLLGGSMYHEDGSPLYSYLSTLLLDNSEAIIIPFFSKSVRSRSFTGSCDGLVCVYDFHKDLYVINPATRWCRSLPRAKIQKFDGETNTR